MASGKDMTMKKDIQISREKRVTFTHTSADANEVMLAGDFNNWDYKSSPMRKVKPNLWKRDMSLKAGRYEYKFVVDGNWMLDPSNSNTVRNPLGVENSVIEVI